MSVQIHHGDSLAVLQSLPDASVNCCVTSPPYWGLRDYGCEGQLGLESTPEQYIAKMVEVFREIRRVLRDDGTLWLNIGDSYARQAGNDSTKVTDGGMKTGRTGKSAELFKSGNNRPPAGLKAKDLVGIPWMLAFALRADGWWLRQDIIWSKPNPMPESVTDRCTKAHEYLFMLSKSERYYYDQDAIMEPAIYAGITGMDASGFKDPATFNGKHKESPIYGKKDKQRGHSRRHAGFNDRWDAMSREEQCSGMRNKRSVWEIATRPFPEAHFATFPTELVKPCILAGCPAGGTVLDPFGGSMTTMLVARELNCNGIAIELNAEYIEIGKRRLKQEVFDFEEPR